MRSRVQEIPEHQVKRSARSQMSARGAQPAMDTVRSTSERVTGRGLPRHRVLHPSRPSSLAAGGETFRLMDLLLRGLDPPDLEAEYSARFGWPCIGGALCFRAPRERRSARRAAEKASHSGRFEESS